MWFNISMINHGSMEACEVLAPLIDYMRGVLSKCGHEVTVTHDKVYPDAVNLFFEHFPSDDMASKFINFKIANSLRVGVIATELMVGGSIPYAKNGILYAGGGNDEQSRIISARMAGFARVAKSADFIWCLLERTALEYAHSSTSCEFFPVGHVAQAPAELRRSPKDIDVVFFGTLTPHRGKVLKAMMAAGMSVLPIGRGFPIGWLPPSLLLSLLDRAKIGINLTLHALEKGESGTDPRFVSCMRVVEMFERDLCVVSEDIPFDNPYRPYMISTAPEDMAQTCRELLDSGRWEEQGKNATAAFHRDMDVTRVCGPIIERTLANLWQPAR